MRSTIRYAAAVGLACAVAACSSTPRQRDALEAPTFELMLTEDVPWGPLNPARGDASPLAGTLYGDRGQRVATGFLFSPVDGFESPPHIHNVTYRGVVIRGVVHNDDPTARPMWMPARSFWTQPKGQVHITSAKGSDTLAYIEIDEGPYLVMPPEEEFQQAENPVNVHDSNLVWVRPAAKSAPKGAKVAYLWEDRGVTGTLLRLPPESPVLIGSRGAQLRAVVIQGEPLYSARSSSNEVDQGAEPAALTPGSYFGSTGGGVHALVPSPAEDTVLYVRTSGPIQFFREVSPSRRTIDRTMTSAPGAMRPIRRRR